MKKQPTETPVWKQLQSVGILVIFWSLAFLPLDKAFWGLTEFAVGFYAGLALLLLGIFLGVRSYVSRRKAAFSKAGGNSAASAVANPPAAP